MQLDSTQLPSYLFRFIDIRMDPLVNTNEVQVGLEIVEIKKKIQIELERCI